MPRHVKDEEGEEGSILGLARRKKQKRDASGKNEWPKIPHLSFFLNLLLLLLIHLSTEAKEAFPLLL